MRSPRLRRGSLCIAAIAALAAVAVGCGAEVAGPPDDADAPPDAIGSTSQALATSWAVQCKAVNTFGYVADVSGSLTRGKARPDGSIPLHGNLTVRVGPYGAPRHVYKKVQVQGFADGGGQYANLDVKSGAPPLDSLNVTKAAGASSSVNAKDGTQYQTDCAPVAKDLRPAGQLIPFDFGTYQGVDVDVWNVGTLPVSGSVAVKVAGQTVSGTIFPYDVPVGADPFVLLPGTRGHISVSLPTSTLARCSAYAVTVDPGRTLQTGPSPFADDTATASTSCLTFTTPITLQAVGFSPDPILRGHTLEEMINSRFVARTGDKQLCATCHYANAPNAYHPPVPQHIPRTCTTSSQCGGVACNDGMCAYAATTHLGPTQVIDDPRLASTGHPFRPWTSSLTLPGWGALFDTHTTPNRADSKPAYLRAVIQRWIDDGAH